MKKILYICAGISIGTFFAIPFFASALTTFLTVQGGTGTTTPSGILYGDNGSTSHLNTVTIGSNLTFSGGTLSALGGAFPFTPVSYGNATSTTLGLLNGFTTTASSTALGSALFGLGRIGASTYATYQDLMNFVSSAGRVSGGALSDAGSGAGAVTAGTGFIKATDSDVAQLNFFDWSASSTLGFPSATSTQYVGVEYNSGTPRITKKTTDSWDIDTEFPLGAQFRETGTVYSWNAPWWVADPIGNIVERFDSVGCTRDNRSGGLIVSNSGTRNVAVTAGTILCRLTEFSIAAIDTSAAGSFDTYYRNGSGGFTKQYSQTQWDNSKYDDGSGTLASMTALTYASRWFYITTDGSLVMIYGQSNLSNLSGVLNEAPPSSVPDRVGKGGILIGRFIVQASASTPSQTQSAFGTAFTAASVTSHTDLSNLSWTASGHTGTADTIPYFSNSGVAVLTATSSLNLGISGGGTNAKAFTTSGNGVYYNGTSLVTAPLTSAVTYPYASTTAISSTGGAIFASSGGSVGIGTTSPTNTLGVVGYIDVDGKVGGYKIDGNKFLYASSTNFATVLGIGAGTLLDASSTIPGDTAIGYQALGATPTDGRGLNTAVGYQTLKALLTGTSNTAVGYQAGTAVTSGVNNVLLGQGAGPGINTGGNNVCVGSFSCASITGGGSNVAIGRLAQRFGSNTDDVAIGTNALMGVNGNNNIRNVAIGSNAGTLITTGGSNIFLGYNTATTTATGGSNILIGTNIELPSVNGSNQLNIGNLLFGTGLTGTSNGTTNTMVGYLGIATSTPSMGVLTIASSSAPQLALSDALGSNLWTMRSVGGLFYLATSTYTATSTVSAFSINANGFPVFPSLSASSGTNCLRVDTAGLFSVTGSACASGTVTSITLGGGLDGASPITTSGTIIAQIGTSTVPTIGHLAYWTGASTPSTLGTVATSSTSCTGAVACTAFTTIGAGSSINLTAIAANSVLVNQTSGSAVPTALATSSLYTFSPAFYNTGGITGVISYDSFDYATSTWTGTTTRTLEIGYGEVWKSAQCVTSVGTLQVDFYHASSHLFTNNSFQASTTKGTITFAQNTTFTAGDTVKVDIGTPASSPREITCTIKKQL